MLDVKTFEALNKGDTFSAVALKLDSELTAECKISKGKKEKEGEHIDLLYTNVNFGIVSTLLLSIGKCI